jgi:hypothetical protein
MLSKISEIDEICIADDTGLDNMTAFWHIDTSSIDPCPMNIKEGIQGHHKLLELNLKRLDGCECRHRTCCLCGTIYMTHCRKINHD